MITLGEELNSGRLWRGLVGFGGLRGDQTLFRAMLDQTPNFRSRTLQQGSFVSVNRSGLGENGRNWGPLEGVWLGLWDQPFKWSLTKPKILGPEHYNLVLLYRGIDQVWVKTDVGIGIGSIFF